MESAPDQVIGGNMVFDFVHSVHGQTKVAKGGYGPNEVLKVRAEPTRYRVVVLTSWDRRMCDCE